VPAVPDAVDTPWARINMKKKTEQKSTDGMIETRLILAKQTLGKDPCQFQAWFAAKMPLLQAAQSDEAALPSALARAKNDPIPSWKS